MSDILTKYTDADGTLSGIPTMELLKVILTALEKSIDAEGKLSGIHTAERLKVFPSASSGGGAAEKKTKSSKARAVKYDIDEFPSAPEGWSGPFEWRYLFGYVKGPDGKTMRFKSFEEAVDAANSMEDCVGITKEYNYYTLRLGTDLIKQERRDPKKTQKGLASWIKGEPKLPEAMNPTRDYRV